MALGYRFGLALKVLWSELPFVFQFPDLYQIAFLISSSYSGFHLAPQLASRAAGPPPARGTRGAVGGTGHIVTRNPQGPFSEFSNFDYLQS